MSTKTAAKPENSVTQKKNLFSLRKMKETNDKVAWVTAYDFPFATAAERAGVDMILVGDSGGMCQLGYQTTNPVVMDEMITLAKSVRRGAPNTFIIGDMPQGAYEVSERDAVINSLRFIKEAGSDAIKCEGGRRMVPKIKAMVDAGILVMGHLGLTPQSTASFGGYRVQGKTLKSFEETIEDALALEKAGIFALLLEAMPTSSARQVAKNLKVPVYGIGAGQDVDGQLIIMHDLMGFYPSFRPWFAKCYIPQVAPQFAKYIEGISDLRQVGRDERADGLLVLAEMTLKEYIKETRNCVFPGEEYSYPIKEEQVSELKKSKHWVG